MNANSANSNNPDKTKSNKGEKSNQLKVRK